MGFLLFCGSLSGSVAILSVGVFSVFRSGFLLVPIVFSGVALG